MSSTDRIEKSIVLAAPRSRVWHALTRAEEFGTWFRMKLDGPFNEGGTVRGSLTSVGHEHVTVEMLVQRVEPERCFSYRWHPYPCGEGVDYRGEPTTLVEFHLEETASGTVLTITESGFDALPAARREEAFRMNNNGWDGQARNLERYVS